MTADENTLTAARKLLQNVRFMALATTDAQGQPWSTPLAYSFDQELNLYWRSGKNSQHSRNLSVNSKVFISVFDSQSPAPGLYIQSSARQIDNLTDIRYALSVDRHKAFADAAEAYLDDRAPRRYYVAAPLKAWVNVDASEQGKFVDIRQAVDLRELRGIIKQ
jgi:hypothetical protein